MLDPDVSFPLQNGDVMSAEIDPTVPPTGTGCLECEATGSWWLHLRRCAACGHIGCCDDSLNRHARAHFELSGHSVIQSFEPGEDWFYSWRTDSVILGTRLLPPTSHPEEQTVPGPTERVPHDWQQQLERAASSK
jgi:hypothetical protein